MASVLLGYGIVCIFMTAYMYIIDSYEEYAASALTFVTFTRYMAAGAMTVEVVPFYRNMGPHVSNSQTPLPETFHFFQPVIKIC